MCEERKSRLLLTYCAKIIRTHLIVGVYPLRFRLIQIGLLIVFDH